MVVPVSTAPAFRPGTPAVLFSVPIRDGGGTQTLHRWDVAPGGKKFHFIVIAPENRSQPIVIVQN